METMTAAHNQIVPGVTIDQRFRLSEENAAAVRSLFAALDDESLGREWTLRSGDHVILSWAPQCGRCHYCATGRPNLCERRPEPGRGEPR